MVNHNIKLLEFLEVSRKVTENYVQAVGEWSKSDQWKKILEEEIEFQDATSPENELEEFWDNFFSKLTLLHQEKFQDDEILKSGIKCWNKIHERSVKKLQESQTTLKEERLTCEHCGNELESEESILCSGCVEDE